MEAFPGEACDSDLQIESGVLMPNAITIPGVLHMTHNLAKDLQGALVHWQDHYKRLKQLEKLLRTHRRERLFAKVLLPADVGDIVLAQFRHIEATLYEERWLEVVKFLQQIQVVLPVLQQHWSEQKYGSSLSVLPLLHQHFLLSVIMSGSSRCELSSFRLSPRS